MDDAILIDEWTEDREDGRIGFELVLDEGDPLLYVRVDDEDAVWGEWAEEDLDGAGEALLKRLPNILAAERVAERARLRRELRAVILLAEGTPDLDDAQDALDIISEALDRICPEEE